MEGSMCNPSLCKTVWCTVGIVLGITSVGVVFGQLLQKIKANIKQLKVIAC